jgi:hypothetical protein
MVIKSLNCNRLKVICSKIDLYDIHAPACRGVLDVTIAISLVDGDI